MKKITINSNRRIAELTPQREKLKTPPNEKNTAPYETFFPAKSQTHIHLRKRITSLVYTRNIIIICLISPPFRAESRVNIKIYLRPAFRPGAGSTRATTQKSVGDKLFRIYTFVGSNLLYDQTLERTSESSRGQNWKPFGRISSCEVFRRCDTVRKCWAFASSYARVENGLIFHMSRLRCINLR